MMSSMLGFLLSIVLVSCPSLSLGQPDYCSNPNEVSIKGHIKSKIVLYSSNVELTCCFPGQSTSLQWYLPDSRPVPNYFLTPNVGPIYALPDLLESTDNKQVLHLAIRGFNSSNTGDYTCRDSENKQVKPARTKLIGRTRIFIDSPKEQYLENLRPGEIRCHVRGPAKINVAWFYQGKHIVPAVDEMTSEDGRFTFRRDKQVLHIGHVTPEFSGHYLCKAEVDGDGSGDIAFIEIQAIDVQVFSDPVIDSVGISNKADAVEGGVLELVCAANGRPSVDITWYQDEDRRIYPDNKKVFVSKTFSALKAWSTLKIVNLAPQDAGVYTCRASLKIPSANITRNTSKSISPDLIFKPRFQAETQLQATGDVGDRISLRCRVFGASANNLRVRFQHNNRTVGVHKSDRYRLEVKPSLAPLTTDITLSITDLQPEDGGQYICSADDELASVEQSGLVRVWYRPRVTAVKPQVYGLPHFRNILTCEARGLPKPEWFWSQNNRPVLSDNFKYYIRSIQKGDRSISELVVLPSYWNTAVFGTYECRAVNRLGESSASVTFTQAWRPDRPRVEVCAVHQQVVSLCVYQPANTGGLPLSYYQVRIQPHPETQFYGPFAYPISDRIELTDLIPDTKYKFAVSAVSPAGRSSNAYVDASTTTLSQPNIELIQGPDNAESEAYNVRWQVNNAGGFSIDHCHINIRPVEVDSSGVVIRGLDEWRRNFVLCKGNDNQFRVNSLSPNTVYEMVISVGTGFGDSKKQHIIFRTRNALGRAMSVYGGGQPALLHPPHLSLFFSLLLLLPALIWAGLL